MQRPLAQENWLGEQVRAGPGKRDRALGALQGERWEQTPLRGKTGCKVGSTLCSMKAVDQHISVSSPAVP